MKIYEILGYNSVRQMVAEKTTASPGKTLALKMEPAKTLREAQKLMNETREAESILISKPSFPLAPYDDIGNELARLRGQASLNCAELLRVCHVLKSSKKARNSITKDDGRFSLLPDIASGLFYDDDLIGMIDTSILSDEEVADDASPQLRAIRRKILSENDSIRQKLNAMIRNREISKYLQDAIITTRDGRFVVPVKIEYRTQIKGLIHGESGSGATVFIEPMTVVEANNRLRLLEQEEAREIERILAALSDRLRPLIDDLHANLDILSYLDFVFARAGVAINMNAFPIEFNDEGIIDIRRGRHPLIDKNTVIPVTLNFSENSLIITGPNTGGKTVTLKLVGLFSMMAQSGMFLPAEQGSTLPLFNGVYADIGDEQSIEQSLSTFSSHMKNIISIVKHAGSKSLVLLDELGAGTDPEEGAALALAILDTLNSRGIKLIATTHYSEIKAHATSTPGFANAGMEFDTESLRPTYRLIMGVAGSSNALLVARRLGLPRDIVNLAEGFMSSERLEFNKLIAEAEKTRSLADKELKKAYELQAHSRQVEEKARQQEQELAEKRRTEMERARKEAYEVVSKARDEAEELISELKKIKRAPAPEVTKTVEKVRREFTAKREVLYKTVKKKPKSMVDEKTLLEGDTVHVCSIDAEATVVSKPDSKGMVTVQAGIMKLNVHFSDLEMVMAKAVKAQRTSRVRLERKAVSMSINLHGYDVEQAIIEVDRYLDDAFLSGLNEVSIIHGKGTGALRSGIQAFLRRHPHVSSFRLGEYGEGDAGVTIVTLK